MEEGQECGNRRVRVGDRGGDKELGIKWVDETGEINVNRSERRVLESESERRRESVRRVDSRVEKETEEGR